MYVKLESYGGGFDTILIPPCGGIKITQPPRYSLSFIMFAKMLKTSRSDVT
jgi:hypothetical protein